ncbi:MAG: topology modulation protein [Proteobacteria bacterium]|nr:topology modulation protein [Pseudomonadota bacterium]
MPPLSTSHLQQYQRINITGNAGAGKTTAAHRLGSRLGLPVHSLDPIVWQTDWKKTPMTLRAPLEEELVARPRWIIDGVSKRVRDAADLVIFLDVPARVCLFRATMRTLRHLRHQRPEFPPGCPEWQIYLRLVRLIWQFPARSGLDIRNEADQDLRYRIVPPNDFATLIGC